MSLHRETEYDTHLLPILSRSSPERAHESVEAAPSPGSAPPELFSRRIDAKMLVVSHLDIFLEAAEQYLQEYGTTHNFGRDLRRCLLALQALRGNLKAPGL